VKRKIRGNDSLAAREILVSPEICAPPVSAYSSEQSDEQPLLMIVGITLRRSSPNQQERNRNGDTDFQEELVSPSCELSNPVYYENSLMELPCPAPWTTRTLLWANQHYGVPVVPIGARLSLDNLPMDIIGRLQARLLSVSTEAARRKVIGLCEVSNAATNVVRNQTGPELSLASGTTTTTANVVLNARVAINPTELEVTVREELHEATAAIGARQAVVSHQSFRPCRPVPTHRL
jgi:hypothetical protein